MCIITHAYTFITTLKKQIPNTIVQIQTKPKNENINIRQNKTPTVN